MGQPTSQMIAEAAAGVHADLDEQLFLQPRSPMGPDDPEAFYRQHDGQNPDDSGETVMPNSPSATALDNIATTEKSTVADQDHMIELDGDSATQSSPKATVPNDSATSEKCAAIDPDLTKDPGSLLVKKERRDGDAQPVQEAAISRGGNNIPSTSTPKSMDKEDKEDILKAVKKLQKSIDIVRHEGKSLHKAQLSTRKEVSRVSARLDASHANTLARQLNRGVRDPHTPFKPLRTKENFVPKEWPRNGAELKKMKRDEVLYLLILYDIYSEEYHGLPDAELKYRFLQYIGVVQAAGSR